MEDPASRPGAWTARGPCGTHGAFPLAGAAAKRAPGARNRGEVDMWHHPVDSGAVQGPLDLCHVSGHLTGRIRVPDSGVDPKSSSSWISAYKLALVGFIFGLSEILFGRHFLQ